MRTCNVIIDNLSRYAQAVPTRNQTAHTTASVLYDTFFVYYGFPARLHSDKGPNVESQVIRTLMNILGTLQKEQKSDWKSHVSTLTHAYNAAVHVSIGFSTFYLMFGRHPRLAIDAFLGISSLESKPKSHKHYADQLKDRLQGVYDIALEESKKSAESYKKHSDMRVRQSDLQPGNRVLVRNVGLRGRNKLTDKWEATPYIVKRKPMSDVPVYEVYPENSRTCKIRTLHRNMLRPFMSHPGPDLNQQPLCIVSSSESEDGSGVDVDGSTFPRYVIPARRPIDGTAASAPDQSMDTAWGTSASPVLRRSYRRRQHPERTQVWKQEAEPVPVFGEAVYTIEVPANQAMAEGTFKSYDPLAYIVNSYSDLDRDIVNAYTNKDTAAIKKLTSGNPQVFNIFICVNNAFHAFVLAIPANEPNDPMGVFKDMPINDPFAAPDVILTWLFELRFEKEELRMYKISKEFQMFKDVKNRIKKSYFIGQYLDVNPRSLQFAALQAAPHRYGVLLNDCVEFAKEMCVCLLSYCSNHRQLESQVNDSIRRATASGLAIETLSRRIKSSARLGNTFLGGLDMSTFFGNTGQTPLIIAFVLIYPVVVALIMGLVIVYFLKN